MALTKIRYSGEGMDFKSRREEVDKSKMRLVSNF